MTFLLVLQTIYHIQTLLALKTFHYIQKILLVLYITALFPKIALILSVLQMLLSVILMNLLGLQMI